MNGNGKYCFAAKSYSSWGAVLAITKSAFGVFFVPLPNSRMSGRREMGEDKIKRALNSLSIESSQRGPLKQIVKHNLKQVKSQVNVRSKVKIRQISD